MFCHKRGFEPMFHNLLGTGQEGSVWPTSNKTAIKVFDRERNFNSELGCYEILRENEISELEGFTIPHLISCDEELLIVEMSIVAPPFILDFGKAYIHRRPDFSADIMEYDESERREMFEGNWNLVDSAVPPSVLFQIGSSCHFLKTLRKRIHVAADVALLGDL